MQLAPYEKRPLVYYRENITGLPVTAKSKPPAAATDEDDDAEATTTSS